MPPLPSSIQQQPWSLHLVGREPHCQSNDRNNDHRTLSPHLLKAQRREKLSPITLPDTNEDMTSPSRSLSSAMRSREGPTSYLQKPPVSKSHPSLAALTLESSERPLPPPQHPHSSLSLSVSSTKALTPTICGHAWGSEGEDLSQFLPLLPSKNQWASYLQDQGS